MKTKKLLIMLLGAMPFMLYPQSTGITLDWCQNRSRENYPLIKQYALIDEAEKYSVSIANSGYLPKITLSGKATDQSDVTQIGIKIPGVSMPELSKDQYQVLAEISETIWDGGATGAQRRIAEKSSAADRKKLEVDLYTLDDRVDQIFFGILLLDEQLEQNTLLRTELDTNYRRVSAYQENGIAAHSDVDEIRVEQLNADQKRSEILASRKAFREMLARMTGANFDDKAIFVKPEVPEIEYDTSARYRPEFAYFSAQETLFDAQKDAVNAIVQPKASAFVQTGYGRPGLNMLNNDFSPFYIYGIRVSWNLDSFYTQKSNLGKIDAAKKMIDVQRDLFRYNQALAVEQQKNEIDKLKELIRNDDEIIGLRTNIRKSAEKKVENGTLSVSELVREINEESLAAQAKSLHEIQLLLSVYNLKNTMNDQGEQK